MEILIATGIIIILFIALLCNSKSGTRNTISKSPIPNYKELEKQAQERLRLENQKRQQEELVRQQEQRRRVEEEKQKAELRQQQEATQLREQQKLQEQVRQKAKIASYKTDWASFQTVLQQNNINRLYHFTDRANLASIRQHGGLLSWYHCRQNSITIPKPGGSPTSWILDERKGLQNFVRVSFVKDHPMMFVAQNDGRIANPIVLEINPEVIYLRNTRFACQNAVKNGVGADNTLEKFNTIKFPLLRQRYFDLAIEDKPFYQAEVLILEKIPLEYITNINHV